MVAKEELLELKTKILPPGADAIIDVLASRHQQLEMTQIVLENVPLLILGRHGMIARIPIDGKLQKVSKPRVILDTLRSFFTGTDKLYVFVNLPDISLPAEVRDVLEEVEARANRKQQLLQHIDEALDRRDESEFYRLVDAYQRMCNDYKELSRFHNPTEV